VHRR
ncbi:ion transport family protein, partial [Vibrio harveyi]